MENRNKINRKYKLFLPGQRIARTVAAVFLCMVIYELRGRRGMPILALIAAVSSIEPYTENIKAIARNRVIGTLIGTAWGVATLLIEQSIRGTGEAVRFIHYLIAAVGTGIVIYFCVWLHMAEVAQFAGTVFLIIVISLQGDSSVFAYAYHRMIDTLIGIAVGEVVNRIQLPRVHHTDTLYASGITNTIFGARHKISGYSLIELNRLIRDGCKFTVSTVETPASVRELLSDVDFQIPIVAMDGAVLYDMKNRVYLESVLIDPEAAHAIRGILDSHGADYFVNVLEHEILVIRHSRLQNEVMREMYVRKRISPYRNYAPVVENEDYREKTIYYFIVEAQDTVEKIIAEVRSAPWAERVRISEDDREIPEGYRCIRILPKDASKENMLKRLVEMVGVDKTITFGSAEGRYDVLIHDANKDIMVKELKRRFEPVSIKGWRNIFLRDRNLKGD